MSSQKKARQRELSTAELNDLIVDSMQDIKAKNIIKLDLRHIEDAPTDFFIICEGDSTTQVKSISDNVYHRVKVEGNDLPSHYEGQQNSLWILLFLIWKYICDILLISNHFTKSVLCFHKIKSLTISSLKI